MKKSLLLLLPLAVALTSARANVTLPALISDNMLLQSTKAVVWGKADPGETVNVKLGQAAAKTTAGADGRWRVELNGLQPGLAGDMTITGNNSITVRNVAVGDVWVCSGQSNMEMTLKSRYNPTGGVTNFNQEISAANHPGIRMFTVPRKASETPVEDLEGKWEVCTPAVADHWSAVAYFFGRQLHQDLGIPIGLISSAWGGTAIQAWMPAEAIQANPKFKARYYDKRQEELANHPALMEKYQNETLPAWQAKVDEAKAAGMRPPRKPRPPFGPGQGPTVCALYNKMIHGATPYGIKGAIWYQGEANAREADRYYRLLPMMINSWRQAWNQPELPFYIVQLANFMAPTPDPVDSNWANLRAAQRATAKKLPNCGLAVTIDIGEEKTIHPANKQEVGRRLALVAEAQTYGKKIVSSGPDFEKAQFEGGSVKIRFKPGTAAGLKTTDGAPIKGFAVAGEDKTFVWADAKIETSAAQSQGKTAEATLTVTAPGVEKPVAIRYAWANNPPVNLVNAAGLPAVPFRTDNWPQVDRPNPAPAAAPVRPSTAPTESVNPAD